MKRYAAIALGIILVAQITGTRAGYCDPPDDEGIIEGIVGFTSIENETFVAFFVPFGSEYALGGIRWFNNDGSFVLPQVLIAPGYEDGPGAITEAIGVATDVGCETLDWTDLEFDQPVASSHTGLHVILKLPVGSEFQEEGYGGGAGFGYQHGETGVSGWVSADGEDWVGLTAGNRFAVQISLLPVVPGMVLMSAEGRYASVMPGTPPGLGDAGVVAAPNPFNPQVQVWYNLPEPAHVRIDVFDVRGRHIRRLLDENRSAGSDYVIWSSDDETGQRVASGTYVLVVERGRDTVTRRVMLLK